jgi:hypothetical protein
MPMMMMMRISHRSSNQSVGSITKKAAKSNRKHQTKKQTSFIKMRKSMEKEGVRKATIKSKMITMITLIQ